MKSVRDPKLWREIKKCRNFGKTCSNSFSIRQTKTYSTLIFVISLNLVSIKLLFVQNIIHKLLEHPLFVCDWELSGIRTFYGDLRKLWWKFDKVSLKHFNAISLDYSKYLLKEAKQENMLKGNENIYFFCKMLPK